MSQSKELPLGSIFQVVKPDGQIIIESPLETLDERKAKGTARLARTGFTRNTIVIDKKGTTRFVSPSRQRRENDLS